jgi:hypothetical protein
MGEIRNYYNIWFGEPEKSNHTEDSDIHSMIILKYFGNRTGGVN